MPSGRSVSQRSRRRVIPRIGLPSAEERPADAFDLVVDEQALAAEELAGLDGESATLELVAAIEHACIVCDGSRILPCHLPPEILDSESDEAPAADEKNESSRRYQAPGPEAEREAIRRALRDADGNRTRAAAALGMGRTTLWQKLKAYGLEHI